jgi:DNA-binding response OmpR family regulator
MIQVLLVEDDPALGRGLNVNLELQSYQVQWVRDLRSARLAREKKAFDLVVLDLGLPDGNGIEFLREIRKTDSKTPVVILTAQTDEDSVVEGLQSGANDYVRKPFGNKELLARIKTALREPQAGEGERLRLGDLTLMLDQRKAFYGEKEIELNRREFDVLCYFVRHAETVVTRERLLEALDKDGEIFDRTIDSHVSHVRTRLKQAGAAGLHIASVYGVGYRLEKK